MLPLLLARIVPLGTRQRLMARAGELGVEGIAWYASAGCAVLAAVLLTLAIRRFKRGELELG
jgi:hypothetical protein